MFRKLILYLFPYKYKVGDLVTCQDWRCGLKACQVDRVYTRGSEKTPYLRLRLWYDAKQITNNVKADTCRIIKK